MDNVETLTGTYSSVRMKDKSDCGSGKVYLEKTTTSDFYKEDFLIKKENEQRKKENVAKSNLNSKRSSPRVLPKPAPKKPLAQNKTAEKKTTVKPGAEDNLVQNTAPKVTPPPSTVTAPPKENNNPAKVPKPKLTLPKPDVIKRRDNELVKTLTTSAKEIRIDLYDNGEIDGDSISVYDNNRLIVSRKGLTNKPISLNIKLDEDEPVHELVMVAENLGSIPPNTALMIVNAGGKRYELFLTSTEKKNAMVVVEYRPSTE